MLPKNPDRRAFWRDACELHGSITPYVLPHVVTFGAIAAGIVLVTWLAKRTFNVQFGLEVAPCEIAGAALGLLLILRTNAGYERWWEARKLWGGIVNQSRNLAISGLAHGPDDPAWRQVFVAWAAAFPHVARSSLRGEPPSPELARLVGEAGVTRIGASAHQPSYVAFILARLHEDACHTRQFEQFAFMQIDRERTLLIDHVGACERILKTPLPLVYSIKIRRFIAIFLLSLPFALIHRMSNVWLVTMLVTYPLMSLDQIGIELQNPFSKPNLSHLPLDDISATIERNVTGLLQDADALTDEEFRTLLIAAA